ncbi:MAG: carboxypeptidase regulatory-like domain-containing protein [Thermoflexales bacterium]
MPHIWADSTVFAGGTLGFVGTTLAGGTANELKLNNIGISTTFAAGMYSVSFKFGEYGGNINLRVNGALANFADFNDIDGTMIGGALASVVNGFGNDMGSVTLNGSVTQLSVSGQELWIDDLCFETQPDPTTQPVPTKSDLGDAPDSRNHFSPTVYANTAYNFPATVLGAFPTTFDPATAPVAQGPGPKHLSIAHAWLGPNVTAESEADLGPDADGVNNILNGGADVSNWDKGDDGWLNQNAVFADCQTTDLVVRVSRSLLPLPATLNDLKLNVWFDGNRNGNWKDWRDCPGNPGTPGGLATEWIVRDYSVPIGSVPIGGYVIVTVTTNLIPNSALSLTHWIRFTLSEGPAIGTGSTNLGGGPSQNDPDGRGPGNGWRLGETEDYLIEGHPQPEPRWPDVGDAPDSTNHWGTTNTAYPGPVAGNFPTVWDTTTAGGGPSGPKHANQIKLEGILGLAITKEDEADQGPDGDIINNIKNGGTDSANRDVADDGWLNPNVVLQDCFATVLKVRVSRGASASLTTMYLNTWFDGNRDGDWEDLAECPQSAAQPPGLRAEWIVRNFVVNMAAIPLGGFQDISVPTGRILNTAPLQNHWVRFTLSEQPVGTANGTFNLSLTPARADGRGVPFGSGPYRSGETEDYVYKPHLQEQPGTLAITKGLINTFGANTANKVITYVIELEHTGGTTWASTTMTDPLPAQVVPVGLPVVTQLNPAVAPLIASLIGNTVVWNGALMPGGKVRIEQAVRVKPCYGPTRVVRNTAYALQTATAGGGVILAAVDFDEFCQSIIHWGTDSVTYTLKLHEDKGWDGTIKGLTAPDSLFSPEPTGPCKPPYLCAEIAFMNNSNVPVAVRVYLVKTPRTVVQINPLGPEGAPGAVTEFSQCPSGKDVVMLPAQSTVTRFSRIRAPGPDMEPDLDLTVGDLDSDGPDAAVLFRASFFDVFTELNAAGSDDDDDPISRAARCIAQIVPVNIVRTDLGDAPDSSNHFPAAMTAYLGVPARFPSVFDPGTGLPQGPKHVRPEHFHLGPRVSRERDADLLPDNDIVPNLRPPANVNDRDRWDDGLMLSSVKFQDCQITNLPIQVFIDPLAKAWMTSTAKLGYINVWVDGNHDGDWQDVAPCQTPTNLAAAPEHIVINRPVNPATLALGVNTINVPTSRVPFTTTEAWLRVTLTTKPISLPLSTSAGPVINYSDGRGELYRLGETEDYLYRQPSPGQTAGSDVWIEKHGAPIGPRAAGLCVGNEQCDDNNTDAVEWSLVFGNRGADTATNVDVHDILSGSNSSGWRVAKIVTSTNFDVFNAVVEVMPGGPAASDLVHVHLNGLPPGNPVRMIIVITRTKPIDIPMYPDPEFARSAPLTNTATITSGNDTSPGNNSASATVVVAGPLLPPVLHGPGDGTVCAGVFTVTGWAIPGSLVQLYADGVPSGTVTATAGGLWWIPVAGLANGPHVLSATSTISAMVSPASNLMNITVDGSLTWSPLSMRFIDAMGGWHRPQDANGRTDVGGWLLALKANAVYTIEVRSCCAGDPNAGISVSFGPTDTVVLTDPDNDGLFTGVYTTGARTPPSSMTVSALCFGIIKTSDGQVLIDPYGNVTDAISNQLLSGALVTNYEKQGSLYAVWDAAAFSQINPQTTAADGYYSFFTPPGTYQIGVTRSGYQNHRSADIVVTNALVRYDVALYPVVSGLRTVTVLLTEDGPDPAVIKVPPGTVVEFTSMTCCKPTYDVKANKKLLALPQAVTDPVFDSGTLLSGESFLVKYDDLGEFVYQAGDTIGTVVVENFSLVFLPMIRK